jgi:5'-nucleotidase
MRKPLILVTNDDGISAPGIRTLVEVMSEIGDVVVVAPDKPQSAMGHAITINSTLYLNRVSPENAIITEYNCSGTPVDCVKLAVDKVLHHKPDFCFSGINHGANHSVNVIYSGTMSAAMEAAIEGIPAIGFSLLDYAYDADFGLAQQVAHEMIHQISSGQIPKKGLYNVNIPNVNPKQYKGLKFCRQANAKWKENFIDRVDPHGKKYYWLTGEFQNLDKGKDTDVWALQHHYASVVPVQFDLTDYTLFKQLTGS